MEELEGGLVYLWMFVLFSGQALLCKETGAVDYFEIIQQVNLTHSIDDCVDLALTPNGRYALVATGHQGSTILVYKIRFNDGLPRIEDMPASITQDNTEGRLVGLDALGLSVDGNFVYTLSDAVYNSTQYDTHDWVVNPTNGTWVTVYRLNQKNGHLSELDGSLYIADSQHTQAQEKRSTCKLLTVGYNRLYIMINDRLYSISARHSQPLVLANKLSLKLSVDAWPSSMVYNTNGGYAYIYIGIGYISHIGEESSPAVLLSILDTGYDLNKQRQLSIQGTVYWDNIRVCRLLNSTQLFVWVSMHAEGELLSGNASIEDDLKVIKSIGVGLATDIKINKDRTRLFLSSSGASLAAFRVSAQYSLSEMEPGVFDESEGKLKLLLLPDQTHILTLSRNGQPSTGALVMYRINEPPPDYTLFTAVTATTGAITLITIVIISSWLTCHWLRNRGARLGYQPLSDN